MLFQQNFLFLILHRLFIFILSLRRRAVTCTLAHLIKLYMYICMCCVVYVCVYGMYVCM